MYYGTKVYIFSSVYAVISADCFPIIKEVSSVQFSNNFGFTNYLLRGQKCIFLSSITLL